jgi:hypothetical protein
MVARYGRRYAAAQVGKRLTAARPESGRASPFLTHAGLSKGRTRSPCHGGWRATAVPPMR